MKIRHKIEAHESGEHGTWEIRTEQGTASGTWRIGSWDIVENETGIDDDALDTCILDDTGFWDCPGVWLDSEWDGESLHRLN